MEVKQAFFVLKHGSSKGLPEYLKAVKTIEDNCLPVIRCEDCKYWTQDGNGYCDDEPHCGNPDGIDGYTEGNDFCSRGERRQD